MKKLFLLLAMAGTMVACGGNDKKDDKQATSVEEQATSVEEQGASAKEQGASVEEQVASAKEQVLSVEEQVEAYANELKAFLKITEESGAWYEGLSDADKATADKVLEELLKADAEKRVKIEEQAEAYAVEMKAASEAGDIEKMAQIAGEMQEWYNTLSPGEQMVAKAIVARLGGSVEEQAKAYVNEMKAAEEAGDYEKFQKIAEESEAWYYGLSDADKATADKVLDSMM